MKEFTQYWNHEFIKNTNQFLNKKFDLCLEIGSFEGLTSNYIAENLLSKDGELICVDPLTDVYLNTELTEYDIERNVKDFAYFKDQYSRFQNNVREYLDNNKIKLIRSLSVDAFPDLIYKYENKFDFIYIDGDHRPEGVYIDAINSFRLCKIDGFILFDDYIWENAGIGMDKFLNEYSGKYDLLIKQHQVLIKKNLE
jgi:predicted O-methyltransferase YrrM